MVAVIYWAKTKHEIRLRKIWRPRPITCMIRSVSRMFFYEDNIGQALTPSQITSMSLALANERFPNPSVISKAPEAVQGLYRSGRRLKDPPGRHGETESNNEGLLLEPTRATKVIATTRPPHQITRNENQPNARAHLVVRKSSQSSWKAVFQRWAMNRHMVLSSISYACEDIIKYESRKIAGNNNEK